MRALDGLGSRYTVTKRCAPSGVEYAPACAPDLNTRSPTPRLLPYHPYLLIELSVSGSTVVGTVGSRFSPCNKLTHSHSLIKFCFDRRLLSARGRGEVALAKGLFSAGRCHACLCRRAMLQIWKPTAPRCQPARISARRAARERHPPRLLQLQLAGERETSDIIDRQTGTTASAPALRRMIICAARRPLRCAAISRRCDARCEPASATTAFRARPPC